MRMNTSAKTLCVSFRFRFSLLLCAVLFLLLCCTGQLTFDRYAVFSIVDVTTAAYISARLLTARCRERQKALPGAQTE